MNRRTLLRPISFALVLVTVGGCGIFSSRKKGPNQVNDLVGMIERVYVESEVAKGRAQVALGRLRTIVSSEFEGDAVTAYADFVTAIESSERQAEKLNSMVGPMKDSADPVFTQWGKGLDEFSSASMRKHSETRMRETRSRYDAIVSAVEPTQATLETFNRGLRDHALFMENDLNPASLAALQDDVKNIANLANSLDRQFDECLLATRAYIETAALPVRVQAEPPAKATPVSGRQTESVTESD